MRRTGTGRGTMRCVLALAAIFVLLGPPLEAHNRGVVHPAITEVAMELLRKYDMINNGGMSEPLTLTDPCPDCAFNELWDHRGVLAPPDGDRATVDVEDAAGYIDPYNNDAASIIIGSVIEDGWDSYSFLTALNHFYHARSGIGLSLVDGFGDYDSSRLRAHEEFIFGLRLMDYTDQSVDRATLYLGRLLHLLEDKTSPAHVHNDAHVGGDETDDYEARYVPELWRNYQLRSLLEAATSPVLVVNATQIWPVPVALHTAPPDNSLAGFTYNRTTIWSTLQYPLDGTPPPAATGELAEMFPGDATDPADDGLHWVTPAIGFDRWVIDDEVGEYHYKASWGTEDEWWPDTTADESGAGNPGGIEAAYYIENLMTGEDMTTAVVPDRHRNDFNLRWHPTNNPVVQNTFCSGGTNDGNPCSKQVDCPSGVCQGTAIVQRQGQFMLDEPVAYAAGAAMWWHRFANMPPHLKKVEVTQNAILKYTAEWLDEDPPQMIEHELREIGIVVNTDENIETITTRNFSFNPLTRLHVNALNDLDLVLEFNEPIKNVTGLELLDGLGATVLDVTAIVPALVPVKTVEDTTWTYTIPAANLVGLNGELTLKVKAEDKNEHTQGGADLDATPQSPAKRNLDGAIDLDASVIPWHNDATNAAAAYDFTSGDLNHRLLFDTEKPTTTISVTP